MAEFIKIFPSRFNVSDFEMANGQPEFSDLTVGALLYNFEPFGKFPGSYGSPSGAGNAMSVRITANNTATQDHEILAVFPGPDVNQSGSVYCRSTASWSSEPNGVVLAYVWGDTVYVERITTSGSSAQIGTIDLASLGRNTRPILCRLRVSGPVGNTQVQCKAWSATQEEPSAWDVNETITVTIRSTGYPVLGRSSTSFPAYLSSFSVGTDGDSAPSLYGVLSGQVQVNGTPQSGRTVRAIAREDPGYHWDAQSDASGNFTIRVLKTFTYTVFALDLFSGSYNAVVTDKVGPV